MATRQSLEGIRVVDFSWVAVGPLCARTLAEHGATVVRVESHTVVEISRVVGPFKDFKTGVDRSVQSIAYNTNKLGISLNLAKPKGRDLAKRLIRWADVVVESFSPGTMKRLGLDYEEANRLNPHIIYASTSLQGQTGPFAFFAGMGQQTAGLAGFCELTGFPDGEPALANTFYGDFVATWFLVTAIVGALEHRRRTGKGMYIDHSQYETALHFLAPAVLDYTANRRVAQRQGNRDPHAAPHGCYPCQGDDRWVAIAVSSDEEWKALVEAMGNPEWAEGFATVQARKKSEDDLDSLVASWTSRHTSEEVMALLQGRGVAAGLVSNAEDLFEDPQLRHRDHFVHLEHNVIGRYACTNEAVRFSKTPPRMSRAGPCLGQDNERIYKDLLGLTDDEISDLMAEGVITTEADLPG